MLKTLALTLLFAVNTFAVSVIAPASIEHSGSKFVAPITLSEPGALAFQFHLYYDPEVITPVGENYGCDSPFFIVVCYVADEGILRAVAYSPYPSEDHGGIEVMFYGAGIAGADTPLTFEEIRIFTMNGEQDTSQKPGYIFLD